MSKAAPLSLSQRWELVRERQRRESRAASFAVKLQQTAALMASVDDFGWRRKLGEDDERVRSLWMKLRRAGSRG